MSLLLFNGHLGAGAPQSLFVRLALYSRRKGFGTASLNASTCETLGNSRLDHLANRAELFANGLDRENDSVTDSEL